MCSVCVCSCHFCEINRREKMREREREREGREKEEREREGGEREGERERGAWCSYCNSELSPENLFLKTIQTKFHIKENINSFNQFFYRSIIFFFWCFFVFCSFSPISQFHSPNRYRSNLKNYLNQK